MQEGRFITFNGINNLGKSTQAKMLVECLGAIDFEAEYAKCPFYDIPGTGQMIQGYTRHGNPDSLSARELHIIQAHNKTQFQYRELLPKLNSGIWIICEGWKGSGIAWGLAENVERPLLDKIHEGLIRPDIEFLFEGERFLESKESGHHFETSDEIMKRAAHFHHQIGREFGWVEIYANHTIEGVHNEIVRTLEESLEELG